jgi:hypothetical protein
LKLIALIRLDPRTSENLLDKNALGFIIPLLAIGLASYAGSHVNQFDNTAYYKPVECFQLPGGFNFKKRPLSCLSEFIGGPAWILERPGPTPENYIISITAVDFANLWGPVKIGMGVHITDRPIYTERGVITYDNTSLGRDIAKPGEMVSHWQKTIDYQPKSPQHVSLEPSASNLAEEIGSGLDMKLLIGMNNRGSRSGLYHDTSCEIDTKKAREERSHALDFLGVSSDRLKFHQAGVTIGSGQLVNGGVQIIWKRIPGRRYKDMIMYHFQHNKSDFAAILRLRVGLEISICTGNSRRITLWEALRLIHDNCSLRGSESSNNPCQHGPGDMECVIKCWSTLEKDFPRPSNQESQYQIKSNYESVLRDTLSHLRMTGVDDDDRLKAIWPYTQSLFTYLIKVKGKDGICNGWIPVLKESRDVTTFAVMSNRCLSYTGGVDATTGIRYSRMCKKERGQKLARDPITTSRTFLETAICIHPESAAQLIRNRSIDVRSCLRLGNVGSVEIRNRDFVQMAVFKSGFFATVSEIATCASQMRWGNRHYELVDDEKATEKTVRVVIM